MSAPAWLGITPAHWCIWSDTPRLIAVVRLRYCPKTRAYANRRTTEGKSKKEIIRCLKRYIAREIYYTLRADLNLNPWTRWVCDAQFGV